MTDVELLPLPSGNVAHLIAAQEAEIEALRAERDALRRECAVLRSEFDESCATINKLTKLLAETAIVIKGPEPDATKWSYHDIPDGVRAIQARAERLAEALRGWWEMRRPVGWTEDQHRACPHVNLATDAEKALATALLGDIHQIAATVAFAVAKMRELGWMPPSNTSTDPPQDAWKAHRVEENGRALLRDQEE